MGGIHLPLCRKRTSAKSLIIFAYAKVYLEDSLAFSSINLMLADIREIRRRWRREFTLANSHTFFPAGKVVSVSFATGVGEDVTRL